MKKKPQNTPPFNGFAQSNTTPVPDVLFDELLSILSGTELKVLLYIIRRTRGFKKDSDAISLNQFQHGIVTKDGKRLDSGCGVSDRTAIVKALKSLEAKKCIFSEKSRTDEGDNATTLYRVFFAQEVVEKTDQGSGKNLPPRSGKNLPPRSGKNRLGGVVDKSGLPVVENTHPQETVIQQTERMNGTGNSANPNNSLSSVPSSPSLNARNTEPLPPSKGFSEEESRIDGYWQELGFLSKPTAKEHWLTLSGHIKSFERFKSLYDYTQVAIKDKPNTRVYPGNLVDHLEGWKQEEERKRRLAEPIAPKTSKEPSQLEKLRAARAKAEQSRLLEQVQMGGK